MVAEARIGQTLTPAAATHGQATMGQIGRFDTELESPARQSDQQQSGPKREPRIPRKNDICTEKKPYRSKIVPIHEVGGNPLCVGREAIDQKHEASAR